MVTGEAQSPPFAFELRLFGRGEGRVNGAPLPRLRARVGLSLLALLALHPRQPLERSWLAATFWPDSDEEQALYNLRRNLVDLRHALGDQAGRLESPTPRTLRLNLGSAAFCDVHAFDAAIARGDVGSLDEAVRLHSAPLLEGCLEEWVQPERTSREQAYLQALETLGTRAMEDSAAGAEAAPCGTDAIHYLRRVVAADPFREPAQRALMQALATAGDRAGACLAYRQFRLRLYEELRAAPAPETTALYHRLRKEGQPQASVSSKHRNRAEQKPEDGRPASRLATAGAGYWHAPSPGSTLIGREREIREVRALVARGRGGPADRGDGSSTAGLITLAGPGGVGKTRLSLAVAEAAAASTGFGDGVYFVDLSSLSSGALVAQAVAAPLGVREEGGRALSETLAERLREKDLLLVLDNCEHLLRACAWLADALLRTCPRLRILATSRQALGVAGESVYQVPPLSVPPLDFTAASRRPDDLTGWLTFEAVRLFVERAMEASALFVLTDRNASTVARICQQLDGMPLAIELAAARANLLTPEQICDRLDEALGLLTRGDRAAPTRQQTLRALIDWSYDLLTPPERVLFRRLSVFAGGWSLEAAEELTSEEAEAKVPARPSSRITRHAVLDLLSELIDRSLVVLEPGDASGGAGMRYRMLETVRQYAVERLGESGEENAMHRRHLEFFAALAEEASQRLMGSEQGVWLDRLEADHDNLRAALDVDTTDTAGGESGEEAGQGRLRLAGALRRFWGVRGYIGEGRQWLAQALTAPGAERPTRARAHALCAAGYLAFEQGDYTVARALLEESLTIFRDLGDRHGIADALGNLANTKDKQGDPEVARALQEESLALRREIGDRPGMALALGNLGCLARDRGDYAAARAFQEESLTLRREMGDRWGVALTLNNLGTIALVQADYTAARSFFGESLALRREIGDKSGIADTLGDVGVVALEQGDYGTARPLFEESLMLRRDLGDTSGIALTLSNLGRVAIGQGDADAARSLLEESLTLQRRIGNKHGLALSLYNLGDLAFHQGDPAAARDRYAESLKAFREVNNRWGAAFALNGLGMARDALKDPEGARACLIECVTVCRETENQRCLAYAVDSFARLALAQGRADRAVRLFGAAQSLRETNGYTLPSDEQVEREREIAAARAALNDKETFTALFAAGEAMALEQATEYALSEHEQP